MIGRFPSKLSLEWKLPAVMGCLLLLVIIALSSAAYIEARREARAAAGVRLSSVTEQLAGLLATSGRQLVTLAQAKADKTELRSYLLAPSAKGRPAASRMLSDFGPQPEQMVSVGLYDEAGHRLLAEGPGASRIDTAATRELLAAAVVQDSGIVERFRTLGDTVIYPTVAPVRDGKKKIGYVVMWRRLTSTPQARQQTAGLIGSDAALYLGNADGGVWSDLVTAVPPPPVPVSPKGLVTYGRPGVGTRLAAARLVAGTSWIVLVEFPGTLVSAPARAFLRTLILISLSLFAIGMAAAWLVSRRITRPLRDLTDAAEHISGADYSARVAVDGEDELGKLARAFNDMASRIDDAYRAEQHRSQVLVDAVEDYAIVFLDPDGKHLTWNRGAERLTGFRREEILGRHFAVFQTPEGLAADESGRVLKVAAAEGRSESEGWRVRKDGTRFYVHSTFTALRDERGNLIGFGAVARDMTGRRSMEEELKRSNAALEAFSYSVAHDLRAPLRAVDGFSKALLEDFGAEFPKDAQRLLDTILQSTRRMGQMIEGLLSFSRLGQRNLDLVPLDPAELVRSVVEELRAAQSPAAEVVLHPMPPVRADRVLMRQVLSNLISNALKFSRDRPHPRVEIGSLVNDGEVSIYVRDNGVGFDTRYADKLFGVFQRLHPVEAFEGNGVGLALVRRIVERHNGRVWAESQNGSGATFYFTLPQG